MTVIGFLLTTATFWLIDTLILFFKFKRPKTLKLDTTLSWGNRDILPNEIFRIKPITDRRFRMSVKMLEVSLTDGTSFYLIDKPKTFIADISGKPSKTLSRLTEKYPELDEKITGKHFI